MKPRLQRHYEDQVVARLIETFGYENPHQAPKIDKVVINVGLGEASRNPKLLESVVEEISLISGQRPIVTRARKAISNFALREGMPVGVKVTLRRERMYEFLDRLINVTLPRVRDFRGVPTDRKSTRLNSSHVAMSYAVFCLRQKRMAPTGVRGAHAMPWALALGPAARAATAL